MAIDCNKENPSLFIAKQIVDVTYKYMYREEVAAYEFCVLFDMTVLIWEHMRNKKKETNV